MDIASEVSSRTGPRPHTFKGPPQKKQERKTMFGGQIVAAYPKNIVGCFSAALHGQDAKKVSNEQKRFAVNLNISLENLRIYLR